MVRCAPSDRRLYSRYPPSRGLPRITLIPGPPMIRLAILLPIVFLTLPATAAAQWSMGGSAVGGRAGSGTTLLEPRYALHGAYTLELGTGSGVYVGGRTTFGVSWFKPDENAYRLRYNEPLGEVEDGNASVTETGADVEVGYTFGPVRPYGFIGVHYYRQWQDSVVFTGGGDYRRLRPRLAETVGDMRGYGVAVRVTDTGWVVAEHYEGADEDGVMAVRGTRFGLRWTW